MPAIGWIRLCTLIKTMLSISEAIKGVNDAVNYHIHEGKEAYYLAGIGQEGRWLGGAVEPLKLPDTVTADSFRHLLHGYSPDGKQPLVQNAGHPDRVAVHQPGPDVAGRGHDGQPHRLGARCQDLRRTGRDAAGAR